MAMVKPGEYITTKCSRCNDVTGHVVMVIVDGAIMKVECKACGSVHKFRETKLPGKKVAAPSVRRVKAGQDRDTAVDVGRVPSTRAVKAPSAAVITAARRNAVKLESAWQEAMVRHSAEKPLPYSMETPYGTGDFLEHPSFGRGEVIAVMRPDKMEVLFQEGVKTLRCKL